MEVKFTSFFKGYHKYLVLGPLCIVLEVILELMLPKLMATIVDDGIGLGQTDLIFRTGALMIALSLACVALGVAASKCSALTGQGLGANVRSALFEKIQDFSFADIDRFSSASLITRMTNDVNNLQMSVVMGMRMMTRAPIQLIVALVIAIGLIPEMAKVLAMVIPLMLIAVALVLRICIPLFKKVQERIDGLNSTVQENLVAIRVVKAFVREDHERDKFKTANNNLTATALKVSNMMILLQPIMMTTLYLAIAGVLWVGGGLYMDDALSIGDLASFLTYIMQILMSVIMLAVSMFQITRAQASLKRVKEVLNTTPDIQNGPTPADQLPPSKGAVSFRNVAFKYSTAGSGDDVLTNINLDIQPGQMVAIVGGTGTGKSSLVNLIPRFYDATQGQVLVDGLDVKDYPVEDLRQRIGMVLQQNVLFSGSIRENLLWGNENADDQTLIRVSQDAQAYEFISAQPQGLDTHLDQGGVNLSGGQKQRLCIARALLKHPSILILDDSTSAVDTATEGRIRTALRERWSDTTVILIAQRISSVQYADTIVVLDEGTVAAVGTHDELMANSPIYKEIYDSQQEGVKE